MPVVDASLPNISANPGQDDALINHESSSSPTMPIIIGLAIGGLLLGVVGVLILLRLNRKKAPEESDKTPKKS